MSIKLTSCPFCEGPPVPSVVRAIGGGEFSDAELDASEDGIYAYAYVFCHECGAHGPRLDDIVYTRRCCEKLEQQAVQLWQARDNRHRCLYDSGEKRGLNEYPRKD